MTRTAGSGRMHLPVVLKIIEENAPITPHGIARIAGIKAGAVRASIRYARERELVHVSGHERHSGTQGPWESLYALGKKKDKKPPVNDRNAYQREYYQRLRAAKLLKASANYQEKTGKRPADPFAVAVRIFQISGQ